ncbi:multidrug effflux MFS transporter [Vannielia litorea]|uniref:multidrug effflux MFS transporter n=1 Tax=Vannielia TaxID=2813041 RepID=UPI001C9861E3|nr:multidrug effflux MFS transporter [Vannielia litorea]MBY6048112.1 multidrug effflux MFS transporter [Vannielia litorea]MBY6075526.1 multidrug effflux MFS transporter [Vannielia litorea]
MSYGSKVRFADRSTPPHVLTLVLVASMTALTMNVFLPSLPAMAAHFNTEYRVIGLAVSLFLAINAVLQIFVGPLSDWFGRRVVLLSAIVLFLLATLGCIYAPTVESFLFFRMCQAVVAAGMVLSRAIVRDVVPMNQAASMIGYVTMGMSLVPMIAPAIGGKLDEWFGWQANFWLMFGFGVVLLGLVLTDLGETLHTRKARFSEQFRGYPALLTSYRFWGYALAAAFASGAFFAYLGGAPFLATEYFGLPPSTMGFYFGFPAVGYLFGNAFSGRFSTRFGINRMILWGCVLTVVGISIHLAAYLAGLSNPFLFFAFFTFVGLGNGLVMPNSAAGLVSVRPDLAGSASGLGGAIQIAGGAALSALAAALLTEGSTPLPLLIVMVGTAVASLVSILVVLMRERQLQGTPDALT